MLPMEGMSKKQTCVPSTTSSPSSALAMHKNSQMISKVKPKIRIIHIFAPEIIKTDVENFRELVQRLTGKPPTESSTKKKPRSVPTNVDRTPSLGDINPAIAQKMELRTGFCSEFRERIKEEEEKEEEKEEIWGCGNSSGGGFLGGFADLDGFMKELNEFPLLPMEGSSHLDAPGDLTPQLA